MSKLGTVLAFLAGAAVGGGSVWYVLKARYEEISEQDICSAKQAFRAREEKLQREIDNLKERLESPDMDTEEPKNHSGIGRQEPGEGRHQRLCQDGQPCAVFQDFGAAAS